MYPFLPGFVEYSINRNAKQLDANTLGLMLADEDGNAKNVTLSFTLPNKNPVKSVSRAELKLDAEGKNVLGIDLDGDCVILKSWVIKLFDDLWYFDPLY